MSPQLAEWINQYGFPIVACFFLAYFIWYIWGWATSQIKPRILEAQKILIELVDRVRMLDNDLIRLQTKLNMILEAQKNENKNDSSEFDTDDLNE